MENENIVHEPHPTFFELFIEFIKEIADFFKYMFNDIYLGKNP